MYDTDATQDRSAALRRGDDSQLDDGTARLYRVGRDEPLDVAITYAIASIEDVDPTDVEPPLHEVVDSEALERLFESATGDARARFRVGDYDVAVENGGREVLVVR